MVTTTRLLSPDRQIRRLSRQCIAAAGLDLAIQAEQGEQTPTLAVVAMEGERVTHIVEKPRPEETLSDLGVPSLYVLSTRVLDYPPRVPVSPRGERDFPDALRLLIEDGGEVGGLVVEWRMTVTYPADLVALNRYFLRLDPAAGRLRSRSTRFQPLGTVIC